MKKIFVIMIALMLMLSACGGSSDGETTADSGNAGSKDAYVFEYKGTKVVLNAKADDIIKALGENYKYFESESCAFKGLDKEYDYGSFVIYTYPVDDVDYILSVTLKDDTVETAEGLAIGAAKADVAAKMGAAAGETPAALTYEQGDSELMFLFENDVVTSIQYTAITK